MNTKPIKINKKVAKIFDKHIADKKKRLEDLRNKTFDLSKAKRIL
jgi:cell division protein FtsL